MECSNRLDNLKDLLKKLLSNKATDNDIIIFCQDMNTCDSIDDIAYGYYILSIYIILSKYNVNDLPSLNLPLVKYILDSIPAKVIFGKEPTQKSSKEEKISEDYDIEDLKQKLIKKWSPFRPENNPSIKYPSKGEITNLYFKDYDLIPGKTFQCEVFIDSEGNIIRFKGDPIEMLTADNYEEIYSGLVGKLLEYQEKV